MTQMLYGPCAKQIVTCTLVTPAGERHVGQNWCENPQPICPREEGEGHEKCRTVCRQVGHAEQVAIQRAGPHAAGSKAYIEGRTSTCAECQHELFNAGVVSLTVGKPPAKTSNIEQGSSALPFDIHPRPARQLAALVMVYPLAWGLQVAGLPIESAALGLIGAISLFAVSVFAARELPIWRERRH